MKRGKRQYTYNPNRSLQFWCQGQKYDIKHVKSELDIFFGERLEEVFKTRTVYLKNTRTQDELFKIIEKSKEDIHKFHIKYTEKLKECIRLEVKL